MELLKSTEYKVHRFPCAFGLWPILVHICNALPGGGPTHIRDSIWIHLFCHNADKNAHLRLPNVRTTFTYGSDDSLKF